MNSIRKKIFLAAYCSGIGHLASAFSLVEILQALYLDGVAHHNPHDPACPERDMIILSKGHGSLALYVVLSEAEYFAEKELWTFCRPGPMLGGEPNASGCPGVEASIGSLGHGLSYGLGMALALKVDHKPNRVYVIVGDGECQEGSIWEAVMSAPAFGLSNLTVIVDHNRIQKMDLIENIMGADNLEKQFASFGWDTKACDGHDVRAIKATLQGEWKSGVPRCLIANTVKGKGLSLMENNPAWHWRMPNRKELKTFCAELSITPDELDRARGAT